MSVEDYKCSACGCVGLHACTGQPIPEWIPEKIEELIQVLEYLKENYRND